MTKTKIIATLGPSSSRESMLRKMIIKGMDIARLNFSHGNHASHIKSIESIRKLNRRLRRHVEIMQDLEGYRIRIGKLENDIELKKNSLIYLSQENITGNSKVIPFDYYGKLKVIPSGSRIYVDDGRILLRVVGVEKKRLKTKVIIPGLLKGRKGVNILDVNLEFESITPKDKDDLSLGLHYRVDYVAQSFVRSGKDISLLRNIIAANRRNCKIFAKVENRQALRNIESIIKEADGIIVARGDLGICLPIYKVPVIQKNIVRLCLKKKKPVVVATQMLDSMTESKIPTRAEVSDVANAILDGATHLLLSQETAVGNYPDITIDMMNKIVKNTEDYRIKPLNITKI